ncbi:hypothetical protein BGW41_001221 [Actinomortierella wolfii]|nr:hypothetical protein BGW41_001221 [Actinomortierella wolfii]
MVQTSEHKKEDSNVFKDAWHSVAEALHLRSDTPPPVPPKDEKWKVKTINKAIPEEQKPDPSFWDRLFHSSEKKKAGEDSDDDDGVSINVPANAALQQLGVEGNDQHLEEKKNYFKRMAQRVKEKFDNDDDDDDDDSDDNDSDLDEQAKEGKTAEQIAEEKKRRRKLAPKVDPKEMQQAHKVLYKNKNVDDSDSDEEEDKKMFGHWWGCRPRRSKADKQAAKEGLLDGEEWEKVKKPSSKHDKEESAKEENGDGRAWWQFGMGKTREEREKERAQKERKATAKRRQALAAAAAYEAVKEYEARRAKKTGKPSSHSEMKAVLAGMAMAEAVKLLEKYNDDDELDDDDKDDTVAEAGNKALKLFELCR